MVGDIFTENKMPSDKIFPVFTTVQLRTGKGFHYQQAQKWLRFKGLFGLVRPSHYSVCTVFTSYLEIRSNTMKRN